MNGGKQTMRTQIYEHRSGLKVVPRDIISEVEKILWDTNPILSKRTVSGIKESVRERLERPANKSQVEISDFLGRQKGNTKSSR